MNLERSSVQIVHSSGKFRAVFLSSSFNLVPSGGLFSEFGLEKNYRTLLHRSCINYASLIIFFLFFRFYIFLSGLFLLCFSYPVRHFISINLRSWFSVSGCDHIICTRYLSRMIQDRHGCADVVG